MASVGEQAQTRPMRGVEVIESNADLAGKVGPCHKACDHMREPPTYQEGVTVKTEYLPHSTVVWVTVAGIRDSRRRCTYMLSQDKPGSSKDGTRRERSIPTGMLC